jgi:hypothetical protein
MNQTCATLASTVHRVMLRCFSDPVISPVRDHRPEKFQGEKKIYFFRPLKKNKPHFFLCIASCPWCSAVTCLVCSQLRRASTPHARVPAGSGARHCPHPRFRTRLAGAAAGFASVGRCLGSDCVLLLVVGSLRLSAFFHPPCLVFVVHACCFLLSL